MSKYVAIEDCEFAFRNADINTSVSGTITATVTKASHAQINGSSILIQQISIAVSGYTNGSLTNGASVNPGIITASAQYAKSDNGEGHLEAWHLEGDESTTITIQGQVGQSTGTTTDTVYIKKAGQNVLKAT